MGERDRSWNAPYLRRSIVLGTTAFFIGACATNRSANERQSPAMEAEESISLSVDEAAGEPAAREPRAARVAGRRPAAKGREEARMAPEAAAMAPGDRADEDGDAAQPAATKTRAWFPDSFIWEPMVETDDDGLASLEVRVPDTLTDWRVLGLAHDRDGQHAGATTSFATRLPVHADARLPSFLYVGDELALPVRAVNGTDGTLSATLGIRSSGALVGGTTASLRLPPNGVAVRRATLKAERAGPATVQTVIRGAGHEDAADRQLRVTPTGRPVQSTARGVLAAETPLELPSLAGVKGQETLELVVFPGPLALVQAEVDRFAAGARSPLPGGALQAVGHYSSLSEAVGAEVNDKSLRRLRLLAWQQMVRRVHRAEGLEAVAMLRALGPHPSTGAVEGSRAGLIARVLKGQKPDGTWSSQRRSTLQRVLVETASSAMVLPTSSTARVKAEGAVERQIPNIADPYTAAVLLGSGVLKGTAADVPRQLLVDAIRTDEQGVPHIDVPDDVVDAWGDRPRATEMLAWTVLALGDEQSEVRGKLAAELMGSWSRGRGFGAGRADPIALLAVVEAVPGASGPTEVSLWSGEAQVATGTIDPGQPGVPLVLMADDPRAVVKLDPPVSGLAYAATRTGYAPWPKQAGIGGLEWTWETENPLVVGERGVRTLRLAGPRGTSLEVEQGLPAGMRVDRAHLEGQSLVSWVDVQEDRVRFGIRGLTGTGDAVELAVTPSFAGRFTTVPLVVQAGAYGSVTQPPLTWSVQAQ